MEVKKMETYSLELSEKELKNPQVKRKMVELVMIRAQLQSAGNTFEVSKAEMEIMSLCPLFTPAKAYEIKKFPNEIGKLKSQRVLLRKDK